MFILDHNIGSSWNFNRFCNSGLGGLFGSSGLGYPSCESRDVSWGNGLGYNRPNGMGFGNYGWGRGFGGYGQGGYGQGGYGLGGYGQGGYGLGGYGQGGYGFGGFHNFLRNNRSFNRIDTNFSQELSLGEIRRDFLRTGSPSSGFLSDKNNFRGFDLDGNRLLNRDEYGNARDFLRGGFQSY